MLTVKKLITTRKWNHLPHWDPVFEWEDIIRESFGLEFFYEPSIFKYAWRFPVPALTQKLHTSEPALMFQMSADTKGGFNRRNIIPCLIDFFLSEELVPKFIKAHSKHPFLLVSSKEVIAYLQGKGYEKPMYHFPLSLADKYAFSKDFLRQKKYDLVLAGRTNSVLKGYLEQYAHTHPDFCYVYRVLEGDNYNYYTSRGESLGEMSGREQYMDLLRASKVGLYATPGMDDGVSRTQGFNPVTPRFLELVSAGCHVLARYPATSETDYYELSRFSPCIDSYELFEALMNKALSLEVNGSFYEAYLSKHYTSNRCALLKRILNEAEYE